MSNPRSHAPGGYSLAAQLTEGWTQSLWNRVDRVLAAGVPETPVVRRERSKPRQRQVRLSSEQWERILEEYRSGPLSASALAKKHGISSQAVINRIHAAGIPIKQPWSEKRPRGSQPPT